MAKRLPPRGLTRPSRALKAPAKNIFTFMGIDPDRPHLYVLDPDGRPRPTRDVLAWGEWFERANEQRRIAFDDIGAHISTVFIGLDHNHTMVGPPLLYETLVFGGRLDGEMERYSSRAEAVAGHKRMVARVRRADRGSDATTKK